MIRLICFRQRLYDRSLGLMLLEDASQWPSLNGASKK